MLKEERNDIYTEKSTAGSGGGYMPDENADEVLNGSSEMDSVPSHADEKDKATEESIVGDEQSSPSDESNPGDGEATGVSDADTQDMVESKGDGSPVPESDGHGASSPEEPSTQPDEKPRKRVGRSKKDSDDVPAEKDAAAKAKGTLSGHKTRKTATSSKAKGGAASDGSEEDDINEEEMNLSTRKREIATQRQKWRREREKTAILDVDGSSMVDDSDGFDEKAASVYQAKNMRMICCGYITGVKFARSTGHYVEAEFNGFRVLIPFKEMDIVLERRNGDSDNDFDNKTITAIRNMVGAEIEFIILDIDENEDLAIASRRMATETRRREVLNGVNRDGEFFIYANRKVVARVLDVHPFYAWVEIAGWRTRLSASELRAEYVEDMTTELANGQRITVTISELVRDKAGNVVDMRISMRDDEKEKRDLEKAMASINIGDIIRCDVVGRSSKVIRLKTHNGARAFCYIAMGLHGRYIPKLDESVTIKVIKKTVNPRTGNPVLQGNILRRSVKPGVL